MLTPDYLLHISEGAEQISAQLHTDIIKDIVRRIQARQMRGNDYVLTTTDKWQIESLMDAGYLRDDIARDIAKATGLQQTEVAEAFEDAAVRTMRYDNNIYRAAGIGADGLKMSPQMIRLMQRNYEATLGMWKNFTRTTADAAQTAFIDTMDQIYSRVLSGASGYTSAFTEAIDKLASDGLIITYPSGHRDTIETATLRCVRTGVSQASAQIQVARMDEMGIDLVVVSSHLGARPEHAVWQGKVYSRSGNSEKYPDFVSSTGYGTGAGLCGWNCRHSFSPYFEGMDNPFLDYDSEENRKAYDESQQQRAMERAIRKTKRRQEVLQAAAETADKDDVKQQLEGKLAAVKKRLKMQNTAYREYCDEHGLRPLPERLKIAKAGRSGNVQQSTPAPPQPQHAPVSFAEKITEIRNRVKEKGMASDSDLHEAGALVKEELAKRNKEWDEKAEPTREKIRRLVDRRSDLELQVQQYTDQIEDIINSHVTDPDDVLQRIMVQDPAIDELQAKIDAILNSEEYKGLQAEISKLKVSIRHDSRYHARVLKETLSEFRRMGHSNVASGVATKRGAAKILREALDYYPEDWIEHAIKSGGITCRKVDRGFCRNWENLIALSGWDDDDMFETAIHELGHYFDEKVSVKSEHGGFSRKIADGQSFIINAEREFYRRRTQGEELKWLGSGYGRNEKTRFDNFIHKYMGKDYNGDAFELVSMGFQYAYTDPETLAKDADMEEWIYGILSLF